MRYAVIFAVVLGSACHRSSVAAGTASRTFDFGGVRRTYAVHVGSGATGAPAKKALVLVLHGMGGSGAGIERRTRFDVIADRAGAVVVYPDAIGGRWNDGWEESATDDVGFLAALADLLVSQFGVDRDRVYVTGLSNGASMAHRLGCERDTIAAIAPVAGDMAGALRARCAAGRAISVLEMHGDDDPMVPYDAELKATVDTWIKRDGCGPAPSQLLPDVDPDDGTRVRLERHAPCREGSEVAFYTIEGGGHAWPGGEPLRNRRAGVTSRDIDASAVIWDFFSTKTRTTQ